jgi:ketosteroid isomerase-like protein
VPNRFRDAIEAHDLELMRDALREDVVFRSPVVFRPYEGRDATLHILAAVAELFEDFRYVDETTDESGNVSLHFVTRVGEREIEGIDHVVLDDEGRVRELTVFLRPLRAVTEFAQLMAERLGVAS